MNRHAGYSFRTAASSPPAPLPPEQPGIITGTTGRDEVGWNFTTNTPPLPARAAYMRLEYSPDGISYDTMYSPCPPDWTYTWHNVPDEELQRYLRMVAVNDVGETPGAATLFLQP